MMVHGQTGGLIWIFQLQLLNNLALNLVKPPLNFLCSQINYSICLFDQILVRHIMSRVSLYSLI